MELFTVNRYDNNDQQIDPAENEKRILEKLKKKIEKKKKKLESIKKDFDDQQNEDIEKKSKEPESMDVDADEDNEPELKDESTKLLSPSSNQIEQSQDDKSTNVQPSDYLILGNDKFNAKPNISMVLPPWLVCPTIISNDLSSSDSSVLPSIDECSYLTPQMKTTLKSSMNIKQLFPVQHSVIPWILDVHRKPFPFRPRDVCVSAPTGSGKTLTYAIPIVQLLNQNRVDRRIRALIVLPVNELAVQVLKVFQQLCEGTTLTCALLSKFVAFETEQSRLVEKFNGKYYSKVDICIATTGRLVEHLHSTEGFSLKSLKILVMDEADRIMEQIHNNWLYHLDSHVKEQSDRFLSGRSIPLCYSELSSEQNIQPHKLLFSATLSQDPEKLQNLQLFEPKLFTAIVQDFSNDARTMTNRNNDNIEDRRGNFIGKFTTPAELTEKYCLTQQELKPLTFYGLIKENNWNRFICFTNSGESAHRLSYVLQNLFTNELRIEELSSGLSIPMRKTILQQFHSGKIQGLICSDALARGIDIKDVDVVISYEAPRHLKTYIHRIGRTARAGKTGLAVTLLANEEMKGFQDLVKSGGKLELSELKITTNVEELMAKNYAQVVLSLQRALKREQQIKIIKSVSGKNKSNELNDGPENIMGQLQSKIQTFSSEKASREHVNEKNVPESWKWENQQNITERKERKQNRNKNKNKKIKLKKLNANNNSKMEKPIKNKK